MNTLQLHILIKEANNKIACLHTLIISEHSSADTKLKARQDIRFHEQSLKELSEKQA